jgi:hypothetical protein
LNSSGFFLLFFGSNNRIKSRKRIAEIKGYFISKLKSLGKYVWMAIIIEREDRD